MATNLISKVRHSEIDPKNPWGEDAFVPKSFAESLGRLVRNSPADGLTISLKSPWGTGKSVFLKRFSAYLENDPHPVPVVYLDAWETDYLQDPLLALSYAVQDKLPSAGSGKRIRAKIIEKAGKLVSRCLPIAIQGAAGALDAATNVPVSLAAPELSELVSEEFDQFISSWHERVKARNQLAAELRAALEEAVEALAKKKIDPTRQSKLVVIVDELDRCRPNYAIGLLERIKHLFGAKGTVFIVASDDRNLPSAVKTLYGPSIDGERYLRKFFDYEFVLPVPERRMAVRSMLLSVNLICSATADPLSRADVRDNWPFPTSRNGPGMASEQELLLCLEELVSVFELSYRDIGQVIMWIRVVSMSAENGLQLILPMCLIACLRFQCLADFNSIATGEKSFSQWIESPISPSNSAEYSYLVLAKSDLTVVTGTIGLWARSNTQGRTRREICQDLIRKQEGRSPQSSVAKRSAQYLHRIFSTGADAEHPDEIIQRQLRLVRHART